MLNWVLLFDVLECGKHQNTPQEPRDIQKWASHYICTQMYAKNFGRQKSLYLIIVFSA